MDKQKELILESNARLMSAEEAGDKDSATPLLHPDFRIVRKSGEVQGYDKYLEKVPENAGRGRKGRDVEIHSFQNVSVCTFIVNTLNPKKKSGDDFRNVQVWVEENGKPKCYYWQVTEIA